MNDDNSYLQGNCGDPTYITRLQAEIARLQRENGLLSRTALDLADVTALLRKARDFLQNSLGILRKHGLTTDDAERLVGDIDRRIGIEIVCYDEEIPLSVYESTKLHSLDDLPIPVDIKGPFRWRPDDPVWPPQPGQPDED